MQVANGLQVFIGSDDITGLADFKKSARPVLHLLHKGYAHTVHSAFSTNHTFNSLTLLKRPALSIVRLLLIL